MFGSQNQLDPSLYQMAAELTQQKVTDPNEKSVLKAMYDWTSIAPDLAMLAATLFGVGKGIVGRVRSATSLEGRALENIKNVDIIEEGGLPKGAGNAVKNLKPQNLMDELAQSGVKYTPDNVVMVTKTHDGKLMWLEKGDSSAGLQHIVDGHASDFANRGINDIPDFLNSTLQEMPVKTGISKAGPYAEYLINGKMYRVGYGTNGFVVSFYPIK